MVIHPSTPTRLLKKIMSICEKKKKNSHKLFTLFFLRWLTASNGSRIQPQVETSPYKIIQTGIYWCHCIWKTMAKFIIEKLLFLPLLLPILPWELEFEISPWWISQWAHEVIFQQNLKLLIPASPHLRAPLVAEKADIQEQMCGSFFLC